MGRCLGERKHGWTDGWRQAWLDGWAVGCMSRRIAPWWRVWVDDQMEDWTDVRVEKCAGG